jgi:hypothetical protein
MSLNQGATVVSQEPAWGEPPPSFVTGSLGLAEQLLNYAETFASEGDLPAACSRARCALEGLEAMPVASGPLRALLDRAKHELGLYEAQWEKRRQAGADGRWSAVVVRERLALGDAE